ncbi:sensor histidine kinase [Wukongibacter baidiensis]
MIAESKLESSYTEELRRTKDDLLEENVKPNEEIEGKKQRDETRKNFITNIFIELKSSIGITKGYAEGLKYNIAKNEEKRNLYYEILIDEADKMDKMVRQLLSISNLESEVFGLEKSILNISVLIRRVVEKFAFSFKEKDIKVKTIIDGNYLIKADYLKIEQAISNFLIDAINHVDELNDIEIRTQLVGEKVRVSVINSGRNIPERELEGIWDSFYKNDEVRYGVYKGTGLGLSIVKSIMEQHLAKYGVINRETGVEFWFEFNIINVK